MFGFGKKEKTPFKIPVEALALRTRIEDENRENYPHLVRYQELVKSAKIVFAQLDAIIAQGEYAEEAVRIKEDIKTKIERLSDKITNNRKESGKEGNRDYVVSNLEYLERKGMRNQAKTLYIEFLIEIESITKYYKEERSKNGAMIEPATEALIKTMAELNKNFFKKYGEDKEIKNMREALFMKIEGLNNFIKESKDGLKVQGLEENARSVLAEIARATRRLSEQ